jgi:hypothetical protein
MSFVLLGILNSAAAGSAAYWALTQTDDAGGFYIGASDGNKTRAFNDNYFLGGNFQGINTTLASGLRTLDKGGNVVFNKALQYSGTSTGSRGSRQVGNNILVTSTYRPSNDFFADVSEFQPNGTRVRGTKVYSTGENVVPALPAVDGNFAYICSNYFSDSAIVKVDYVNRTIQWARFLAGDNKFVGAQVATVDSLGNVIIFARGTANTSLGGRDGIGFWKLDSNGNTISKKTFLGQSEGFDTTIFSTQRDTKIDSSNNIYFVGEIAYPGSDAGFMVGKLDSNLNLQWLKKIENIGQSDDAEAVTIDFDSEGNVYFAGTYRDSSNNRFAFFAKLDTSGTIIWQRTISTGSFTTSQLAVDDNDDLLINLRLTSPNKLSAWKLPNDGSLTGTYVIDSITFNYQASSLNIQDVSPINRFEIDATASDNTNAWDTTNTELTEFAVVGTNEIINL